MDIEIRSIVKALDKYFGFLGTKLDRIVVASEDVPGGSTNSNSSSSTTVIADYKSPSDFTATYDSDTSVVLSDLTITIEDSSQISYIKYISEYGSGILVNGANDVYMIYNDSTKVITVYGLELAPFNSYNKFEVGINTQTKAYDSTNDSIKTRTLLVDSSGNEMSDPSTQSILISNISPEHAHYTSIETSNIALNLADATTTYFEFTMDSYKNFYLQLGGTNVTFTIEATGDDSLWDDVSSIVLGAASYVTTTADSDSFFAVSMMPLKFRVVCLTTSATNATTINLRRY